MCSRQRCETFWNCPSLSPCKMFWVQYFEYTQRLFLIICSNTVSFAFWFHPVVQQRVVTDQDMWMAVFPVTAVSLVVQEWWGTCLFRKPLLNANLVSCVIFSFILYHFSSFISTSRRWIAPCTPFCIWVAREKSRLATERRENFPALTISMYLILPRWSVKFMFCISLASKASADFSIRHAIIHGKKIFAWKLIKKRFCYLQDRMGNPKNFSGEWLVQFVCLTECFGFLGEHFVIKAIIERGVCFCRVISIPYLNLVL